MREIRVLGLLGPINHLGASEIYRITLPYTYLNNQGFYCAWMTAQDAMDCILDGNISIVLDYDIIVLAKHIAEPGEAESAAGVVSGLRTLGAHVVYESDDDYTIPDEEGRTCLPYLPHVDAVIASTKYLASRMAQHCQCPVYVIRNAIDHKWFAQAVQEAVRHDKRLTVMLTGTKRRYGDWQIMREVIPVLRQKYPDVRFVAAGFLPDYLRGLVDYFPPVSYTQYPGMLRQADILCAPLAPDDEFNLSKSAVKALEGWSAVRDVGGKPGGCAMVVEDTCVYRGVVQHRHNGLFVKEHSPKAWIEALERVIEDKFLRQKLQRNGYKDAARYDISRRWTDWAETFRKIAGG